MNVAQSERLAINVQNNLIPPLSNPFFIVSPPLARISAGVTVLHLLCHYLNRLGEAAYIVHYPPEPVTLRTLPRYASLQNLGDVHPGLLAPLLTQDVIDFYDDNKIVPIVIYPEVFDNPLGVEFFGRFILNYPGKLNTAYVEHEAFAVSYSRTLANYCETTYTDRAAPLRVLFLPTCDLNYWVPDDTATRSGTCYYAGKLRHIHGGAPEGLPYECREIKRASEMSKAEVRRIFQQSTAFYCYEDTALAIEAILCGCPTVFVPNRYFDGKPLAAEELGNAGWCIATDTDGLDQATKSVGQFRARVATSIAAAPQAISAFALEAKLRVAQQPYAGTIKYPYEPKMVFFDKQSLSGSAEEPEPALLKNELLPEPPPRDDDPRVALRPDVIRAIATEVWFEHQRWSFFHRLRRRLKNSAKNEAE